MLRDRLGVSERWACRVAQTDPAGVLTPSAVVVAHAPFGDVAVAPGRLAVAWLDVAKTGAALPAYVATGKTLTDLADPLAGS